MNLPAEVEALAARTCTVTSCARSHYGRDLCHLHWQRWRKRGVVTNSRDWKLTVASEPLAATYGSPVLPDRIWNWINVVESGCWRWDGRSRNRHGHGRVKVRGQWWGIHRLTYTVFVGAIPNGLHMDHYLFPERGCIGPACCHPQHVRPATPRENTLRADGPTALNLAKELCGRCKLPLSGSNLYTYKGGRYCRSCRRAGLRAWRARKAAS